ncbi:MAG: endolytic transglycosylase MltG [Minisyncoccota bacterium]
MELLTRYVSIVRLASVRFFSDRRGVAIVIVVCLIGGYWYLFAPPVSFSPGSIVRISQGASVPEIATELADAHIISHPILLRIMLRLAGASTTVQTGVYKFETPPNIFLVAYRLVTGDYGLPPVRITFVEGTTLHDDAVRVAAAFPDISTSEFLAAAHGQEGYLFPDTYFFQSSADAASIVARMRSNFDTKIEPLLPSISASGHSLGDIVTMASLIEGEASSTADRRMVSGILWNRMRLGMPLQVDVARDTYTHKGLPATPINNPGVDSLDASVNPAKTNYLYYLTGHDGLMHYATTYAGHQANLHKYLN